MAKVVIIEQEEFDRVHPEIRATEIGLKEEEIAETGIYLGSMSLRGRHDLYYYYKKLLAIRDLITDPEQPFITHDGEVWFKKDVDTEIGKTEGDPAFKYAVKCAEAVDWVLQNGKVIDVTAT